MSRYDEHPQYSGNIKPRLASWMREFVESQRDALTPAENIGLEVVKKLYDDYTGASDMATKMGIGVPLATAFRNWYEAAVAYRAETVTFIAALP